MKLQIGLGVMVLASVVASSATARTYLVDETQSRFIACYHREYVPAVVRVNTRGKLVQAAYNSWDVNGDQWNYVRNPGVYIQTRRIVEPDHYTLIGNDCK
jgi:hypothetical protein